MNQKVIKNVFASPESEGKKTRLFKYTIQIMTKFCFRKQFIRTEGEMRVRRKEESALD